MSRLVRLWTDASGQSQFSEQPLDVPRTSVAFIHLEESRTGSALTWHDAPTRQYVITLTGELRFTTRSGASFLLGPGDVLLAEDTAGGGHRWELLGDQPWRRLYIELTPRR